MDLLIFVAPALDAALALGQVAGSPWAVEIMKGYEQVLNVCSGSHLEGTAQQDAHLPGAYLSEQLFFLHICVGFMDERDLLWGHSPGDQLLPDVLIDGEWLFRLQRNGFLQHMERRVIQLITAPFQRTFGGRGLGCANIAKHELGQLLIVPIPPAFQDILHTAIDLGAFLVRQHGVDDPLIQAQLPPIAGNF